MAVALAEQSGVITEIGKWVLQQACLDRKRWQRPGQDDGLELSVNVSPRQLMTADFAGSVAAVLASTGTDPQMVTLEVTESVFVQDGQRALLVLDDLKSIGVHLALDDFGSGYSSLSYLRRFPVDTIKIDQGFINELGRDRASRLIVDAVVGLAHGLSMTVVAEGVETVEQRREVSALGCEFSQGFFFAKPMATGDLEDMLGRAGHGEDVHLPLAPALATIESGGRRRRRGPPRPPPATGAA
jgi:EAL domain-containing protein (putative c-di-GMP-specific phosphodiesterase class I)